MFAGIGSMQALVPPQITEMLAVGAMASLCENRSGDAALGRVRARAALFRQHARGGIRLAPQMLEHAQVRGARQRAFERNAVVLQPGVETHGAEADRALAHRRVLRACPSTPAR